jgi:uracil phosphoribosyltransferase
MHTANRVHLIDHPLIAHSLTILREQTTGTAAFRRHAGIVSTVMLIEATRHLGLDTKSIQTPLTATTGSQLAGQLVVVPVLRAGLAMLTAAQELLADAPVGFLGLERDETTAIAREYYQKLPGALVGSSVLILDPMLATGGSLEDTIAAVQARDCRDITLVCIVAAPEGIRRITDAFPDVTLYTASIDSHLDERKYIVPGLGDFGDRYFGT